MRGLHQQTTGVRLSLPTDVSGKGWTVSRLADAWVEPKIAHQVRWAREPRDIPDHSHERDGRGQADSWDGHQAQHPTVRKRGLGDTFNGPVELGFQGVEQSEHTVDLMALLDGQRDIGQPRATGFAEQVSEGLRNKVTVQNGVNPIPQSGSLLD